MVRGGEIKKFTTASLLAVLLLVPVVALAAAPGLESLPGDKVPAALITQGSPGPFEALFVDKSLQRMFIFRYTDAEPPQPVKVLPVSTGKKKGDKVKEGDRRTPEGVYFFIQSHRDRRTTIFGRRAYKMNYPDPFDNLDGRQGNGIYLHGTNRPLGSRDTNGCVVMKNQDLEWLSTLVKLKETPIVIVAKVNWISRQEYLLRRTGLNPPPKPVLIAANIPSTEPSSVDGTVVIDLGRRRLFRIPVQDQAKGRGWQSVYTTGLGLEPTVVTTVWHAGVKAGLKESGRIETPLSREVILDFLQSWITAWESRIVADYLAFYHSGFKAYGMNLAGWRKYKSNLSGKYREIDVRIEGINIKQAGTRASVSFRQTYYSDQYQDYGLKRLRLIKTKKGWKIYRENWVPLKGKGRRQG